MEKKEGEGHSTMAVVLFSFGSAVLGFGAGFITSDMMREAEAAHAQPAAAKK